MTLDEAAAATRTGDVWLFRGRSPADRAIRLFTNSPVNHVGMVIAVDDLPPLLWHAEMAASLPDVWSGLHQRGAQLHLLVDAVERWTTRYRQQAWMRAIDIDVTRRMEDAALATVQELDGRGFPASFQMARGWLQERLRRSVSLEDLYCAELVALTYERMGLLDGRRPPNWYDPGRFWSGDRLQLVGATLGPEIAVSVTTSVDGGPTSP